MKMLLAAALIVVPVAAHAATYEFDTTKDGKVTEKSLIVLAPSALCMSSMDTDSSGSQDPGDNMVFTQNPPVIYTMHGGQVEKLDQARIDQLKQQMQAALGPNSDMRKKMEEALAKVPPEQREMMRKQMEKYMGAAAPQKHTSAFQRKYTATGRSVMQGHYKAAEYAVTDQDGKKVGNMMLTSVSTIPEGSALLARLHAMMDYAQSLVSQFGMGSGNFAGNILGIPDGYFPVGGQEFDHDGKVISNMTLASVTKDTPESCKAPE